jgi:hypothetical protein
MLLPVLVCMAFNYDGLLDQRFPEWLSQFKIGIDSPNPQGITTIMKFFRSKKKDDINVPLVNKVLTEKLEKLSDKELLEGIRLLHWIFASHYRESLRRITTSSMADSIKNERIARLNTRMIERASPYLLHEIGYRTSVKSAETSSRIGWISLSVAFVSLFIAFVKFMMGG